MKARVPLGRALSGCVWKQMPLGRRTRAVRLICAAGLFPSVTLTSCLIVCPVRLVCQLKFDNELCLLFLLFLLAPDLGWGWTDTDRSHFSAS